MLNYGEKEKNKGQNHGWQNHDFALDDFAQEPFSETCPACEDSRG